MIAQSDNVATRTPPHTRRLRILHIVWWGKLGGIGKTVADLAAQLDKRGHVIDICVMRRSSSMFDSLSSPNVRVIEIGARSGFDIFALVRFCRFLRHASFDVIHNHAVSFLATLGLIFAGGHAHRVFQEHGSIKREGRKRLLFYRLFRNAYHRFIAVSNATAVDLHRAGIPADRIVTMEHSVDTRAFSPNISRAAARESLGLPPSALTVGTACRFVREKDLPLFLAVASKVVAARPGIHFVLVGEGPEQSRLQQSVEALHLTRAVHFVDPSTDMPLVWRALDVYVFTSISETFGRALIESLSCETPLVAAVPLDGGAADVVRKSPGILSVEDRDPQKLAAYVLRLLGSPAERHALGRAGRKWVVENYDISAWAERFISFYQSL